MIRMSQTAVATGISSVELIPFYEIFGDWSTGRMAGLVNRNAGLQSSALEDQNFGRPIDHLPVRARPELLQPAPKRRDVVCALRRRAHDHPGRLAEPREHGDRPSLGD